MSQQTAHPLVVRYLDDLHRLMAGIDPVERAEVLDGVREHLEASLPKGAGDDDVRAALAELGSPESVADEAYAGRPRPATPRPPVPVTSRSWLPVVVALLQVLAMLVVLTVAGMSGGVSEYSSQEATPVGQSPAPTVTHVHFDGSLFVGVLGFFGSLPFWLVMALLVGISGLWRGREKLALVLLVPGVAALMSVLPLLGWALARAPGVYVSAWTALTVAVLGGGWLVVVLTRRATRRAAELT